MPTSHPVRLTRNSGATPRNTISPTMSRVWRQHSPGRLQRLIRPRTGPGSQRPKPWAWARDRRSLGRTSSTSRRRRHRRLTASLRDQCRGVSGSVIMSRTRRDLACGLPGWGRCGRRLSWRLWSVSADQTTHITRPDTDSRNGTSAGRRRPWGCDQETRLVSRKMLEIFQAGHADSLPAFRYSVSFSA
jgi:hypothetical protein